MFWGSEILISTNLARPAEFDDNWCKPHDRSVIAIPALLPVQLQSGTMTVINVVTHNILWLSEATFGARHPTVHTKPSWYSRARVPRGCITGNCTLVVHKPIQKISTSTSNFIYAIGVARILSGVHFSSPKKLTTLFSRRPYTLKLPIKPPSISPQFPKKWTLALPRGWTVCLGVHLQLVRVNVAHFFPPPWGVRVHPVHPLATPMIYANFSTSH